MEIGRDRRARKRTKGRLYVRSRNRERKRRAGGLVVADWRLRAEGRTVEKSPASIARSARLNRGEEFRLLGPNECSATRTRSAIFHRHFSSSLFVVIVRRHISSSFFIAIFHRHQSPEAVDVRNRAPTLSAHQI
jgi:hypothetical protein